MRNFIPSLQFFERYFKNSNFKISFSAFFGGILTLGLEMVAGRLLTPYFGSSLHQWAALIGVILLAYVIGYENHKRINRWGPIFAFGVGGIYVLTLPLWLFPSLKYLLSFPLAGACLAGAALATGLPSVLWASLLPHLQKRRDTANSSARVLTWSTAGNLIGVWGVAFIGIPQFGTRMTLVGLGFLSLLAACIWFRELKTPYLIVGFIIASTASSYSIFKIINQPNELEAAFIEQEEGKTAWMIQQDTAYQQIAIWDGELRGQSRRGLILNGNVQFYWNKNEKLTSGGPRYEYYNYATAAATWIDQVEPKSILALGVGGGLIPWQIQKFFPRSEVTGFEIDTKLMDLAERFLPVEDIRGMNLEIGDSRFLLRKSEKKYDFIFLDCFFYGFVPFHLLTREFLDDVRNHLNPGGIFAINLHSIFELSGLLGKIEKTLAASFPNVASVDIPSGHSLLIATTDTTPMEERIRKSSELAPLELRPLSWNALEYLRHIPPAIGLAQNEILTDDLNPVEQLLYETRKYVWVQNNL